jgi:hypothetical protein
VISVKRGDTATLTPQLYDAVLQCEQKLPEIHRVEPARERVARVTQTLLALRSGLAAKSVRPRSVEPVRQTSRAVSGQQRCRCSIFSHATAMVDAVSEVEQPVIGSPVPRYAGSVNRDAQR